MVPFLKKIKASKKPFDQFIGYYDDEILTKNSSSGGVATGIAKEIISRGGVVYGASLVYINNSITLKHIGISQESDLFKIQGSKYMQSTANEAICECVSKTKRGELVAFFGTSCQIEAIKILLDEKEYQNLLLVDLVCHGVPKDSLFNDYIAFLETKYKGKIIDISFRTKASKNEIVRNYAILAKISKHNQIISKVIPLKKSSFYRMYMQRAGYRPSCYNCPFANLGKPSDITLGDFYNFNNHKLPKKDHLSLILANTKKGFLFLNKIDKLRFEHVDVLEVLNSHENLKNPLKITANGQKMEALYNSGGFKKVQRYVDSRNLILLLPSFLKSIFRK